MSAAEDAMRIAHELVGIGVKVSSGSDRLTRHYGALLLTQVRANASGRPGPRVVTGAYRASINLQVRGIAGGTEASVGTNAPQGRRLELGFVGVDSLGRQYAQSPLPHFGPAADKIGPEFADALEKLVTL